MEKATDTDNYFQTLLELERRVAELELQNCRLLNRVESLESTVCYQAIKIGKLRKPTNNPQE